MTGRFAEEVKVAADFMSSLAELGVTHGMITAAIADGVGGDVLPSIAELLKEGPSTQKQTILRFVDLDLSTNPTDYSKLMHDVWPKDKHNSLSDEHNELFVKLLLTLNCLSRMMAALGNGAEYAAIVAQYGLAGEVLTREQLAKELARKPSTVKAILKRGLGMLSGEAHRIHRELSPEDFAKLSNSDLGSLEQAAKLANLKINTERPQAL